MEHKFLKIDNVVVNLSLITNYTYLDHERSIYIYLVGRNSPIVIPDDSKKRYELLKNLTVRMGAEC